MFRLIPAPLHRAALVVAHQVRLRWWRIRKPLLLGCRVMAFDDQGRVLLIRHSYGSGRWMLPGGSAGWKASASMISRPSGRGAPSSVPQTR